MSELEVYTEQKHADGTSTNTFRYNPDSEQVVPAGASGAVAGMAGMVGSALVGLDPFTGAVIGAAMATGLGGGIYKSMVYSSIRGSIQQLSNVNIYRPKFSQVRRTLKEKRFLLLEDTRSTDGKNKVVKRELVTNLRGIWVEETLAPIATTAAQVKSWDTVLDSIIKVHGLENLDKIASSTIPALSQDGQKLSWRATAGNILGELGVLQECTNRNCSTECRHFF